MKKKNILFSVFIMVVFLFSFMLVNAAPTPSPGPTTGEVTTQSVCASGNMTDVKGIINWGSCLLMSTIVPFLFAIATAAFIWGVIAFYLNPDNEEKRKKGKSFIIGGLIALFVITSMWGIVRIFSNTFDTGTVIPSFDNIN